MLLKTKDSYTHLCYVNVVNTYARISTRFEKGQDATNGKGTLFRFLRVLFRSLKAFSFLS